MASQDGVTKIADALDEATRNRDPVALRALYADDAIVWHAATNREQSVEENVAMLTALYSEMAELQYIDVRRSFIEDGFVQQHRLVAKYKDGTTMPDVHACAIVRIGNGKIVRIDEYFDMSAVKDDWQRLSERAAAMRNAAQA